jgi:superfamily II DNA/RNA helicase
MTFSNLGLSSKVLAAVEASGYQNPTPIQAQAIPHVMARRDVLGIAQTGTGKTASFVLPMLTLLEQGRARARMPRTLILEPTRELAAQVEENFARYGRNHKLTVALIIGGVSFEDQLRKLDRGVDVLIATPGRLLDLFDRGKLLMNGVEIVVIDEADRMLDMGFIPDIERIIKLVPFTRQTLFFSATMPPEIQRLADNFLSHPERVEVARPASVTKTVKQWMARAGREPAQKRDTLRKLIRGQTDLTNAIIFANRKRDVAVLARSLQKHGFDAGALHGDMDQRARTAMLDSFRKNQLTLLVASDVAARGLDIPAVSHIFNFDIPTHAEDYVHRIGRTGRAGRSGIAITLVTPGDSKYLAAIEKLTGDAPEWLDTGVSEAVAEEPGEERSGRGRRGDGRRGRGERSQPREHQRRSHGEPASAPPEAAVAETGSAEPREPKPRQQPPQREARPEGRRRKDAPHREERRPRLDSDPQPPRQREHRGGGRQQDRDQHRHDRDRQHDNDKPVVGLGDHVPEFLRRPVRLPSS